MLRSMPQNSRKRRATHKKRSGLKQRPLAVEVERGQSSPSVSEQAPVEKPAKTKAEQAVRYPYVLSELRRSLTITAVILVLLVVLYFLLR